MTRRIILRRAVLVFAVALAVRLAFVLGYTAAFDRHEAEILEVRGVPAHAMVKSDAGKYFADAVRIQDYAAREGTPIVPSAMGPFLYPRLLAVYGAATGGVSYTAEGLVPAGTLVPLFLFQAFFAAACLVPFFLGLHRILPARAALVAALFLAVEPTSAQYAAALMTEGIYFGLLMLAVAAWCALAFPLPGDRRAAVWRWAGLGLLLGVAFLHKPISILLPGVFVLATLATRSAGPSLRRAAAAGATLAGYAVVLLGLGLHNLAAADRFEVLPGQAENDPLQYIAPRVLALAGTPGVGLLDLNESPAVDAASQALYEEVERRLAAAGTDRQDLPAFNRTAAHLALDVFAEHPLETALVVGVHVARATGHLNPFQLWLDYKQIYKSPDPALAAAQWREKLSYVPAVVLFSALVLLPVLGGWLLSGARLLHPSARPAPMPPGAWIAFTLVMLYFPALGGWLGNDRYVAPNLVAYAIFWAIFMCWLAGLRGAGRRDRGRR